MLNFCEEKRKYLTEIDIMLCLDNKNINKNKNKIRK